MKKQKNAIKQKDRETFELQGPCLYVHDVTLNKRREKRRLYHCYSLQLKTEHYLVETNLNRRQIFEKIDDAIDVLFSEKTLIIGI